MKWILECALLSLKDCHAIRYQCDNSFISKLTFHYIADKMFMPAVIHSRVNYAILQEPLPCP